MRNPNGYGSVYKMKDKKRRKPWRALKTLEFDIITGKQTRKTIGYYETRKEALEALVKYNVNPYNLEAKKIAFKEVYKEWSEQHFKNISERTIAGYKMSYKALNVLEDKIFSEIKPLHLQKAMDAIIMAESSKRIVKSFLKSLYAYALKYEIVDKDYSNLISLGKKEAIITRKPYTDEEILKLWKFKDLPWVDTILIMIYSGLRIGELLTIKNQDIDLENRTIRGGIKTDAGKNRLIPINMKILPFIKARMSPSNEYLIVNARIGKENTPLTYDKYRYFFNRILEILKMEHTIHDCRHTFATLLSNANANETTIAKIIGHGSFETTEKIYTHKNIEELKKAIDLI